MCGLARPDPAFASADVCLTSVCIEGTIPQGKLETKEQRSGVASDPLATLKISGATAAVVARGGPEGGATETKQTDWLCKDLVRSDDELVKWGTMLLLFVASSLAQGCYQRQLTGDEVREMMTDATVTGRHTRDNYRFTRVYRANGTFEQVDGPRPSRIGSRLAPPQYTGTWRVGGDSFCIRWSAGHPKGRREFCRRVMTDDKGSFWKEFSKRKGGTVKVVTYLSIRGTIDGNRLVTPSSSEFTRRWMATWRGWLVYLLGAAFLIWLLHKLFKGKYDASSLRNRLRLRLFGFKAGPHSYSRSEFNALGSESLIEFIKACSAHDRPIEKERAIGAFFNQPNQNLALARLWDAIKSGSDSDVQETLKWFRDVFSTTAEMIAAVDGDVRFAFLMGRSYSEAATLTQSTSESLFENNKSRALEYWKYVREHKPGPPPELAARVPGYRESAFNFVDGPDYSNVVGAAYEAMMYMNYKPPPKPSRSSSYSSSSSSGGG